MNFRPYSYYIYLSAQLHVHSVHQLKHITDITDPVKNRRICNRWLVAYTLLHNPSVRPLRAPRLLVQEQQNQKEEEAMAEHSQKEKEAMAEGNVHEEIQLRC